MSGETSKLAAFVGQMSFDRLPEPVVAQAKLALLNFAACAVAGSREDVVLRAVSAFTPLAASGKSSVIGRAATCDAASAAFHNAMASSVLAFDETHSQTVLHPVGPVAAALLALAEERHLDGRASIVALVAGVEVASRASMAVFAAPARASVGWSPTGLCAGIGAAAAGAKLLRVQDAALADAIALGANAGAGLRAMNGTMAVTMAAANAAGNGVRSALLAAAGVSGPRDALEHAHGFVALHAEQGCLGRLANGLGESWAIEALHYKPYPCGVVAHAAIDAARDIRLRPGFDPSQLVAVQVAVHPSALPLGDRPRVESQHEAAVSIQYWVATALLRDDLGLACLRASWMADDHRRRVQDMVELAGDENLPRSAAHLRVRLTSGTEFNARVLAPRGSADNPMTWPDVETKFCDAATERLTAAGAGHVIAACREFERIDDIGRWMHRLRCDREEASIP
jgi:2-methylcitrate dehydratase PrpD